MADVSAGYDFDPDDYPLLDPPLLTRSLGIQPPLVVERRAVPIRWMVDVTRGTGDFLNFLTPTQVLWDGLFYNQQPMQLNDRRPSSEEPYRRLSILNTTALAPRAQLELRLYPDPERFVVFSLVDIFTDNYREVQAAAVEVQGDTWEGSLTGVMILTPIFFWEDLNLR